MRFLAANLEATFVVLLWGFVILLNSALGDLLPYPVTLQGSAFCMLGATIISLPLIRRPRSDGGAWPKNLAENWTRYQILSEWKIFALSCACLAGFVLEAVIYNRFQGGANLEEIRQEYVDFSLSGGVAVSKIIYLAYLLKGLGAIVLILVLTARIRFGMRVLIALPLLLAVLVDAVTTGGRTFLRLLTVIGFATLLIHYRKYLVINWHKTLIIGVSTALAISLGNIAFNDLRADRLLMTSEVVRAEREELGNSALKKIGIDRPSFLVANSAAQIVGYLGSSVGNFSFFVERWDLQPCFGAFAFPIIGSKIPGVNPTATKMAVDEYYVDLAIRYNVWATGFRELIFDTGLTMFFPVLLVLGIAARYLRLHYSDLLSLRVLYILIVAWAIYSPFESLTKMQTETTVYLCFILFFIEKYVTGPWIFKREKTGDKVLNKPAAIPGKKK